MGRKSNETVAQEWRNELAGELRHRVGLTFRDFESQVGADQVEEWRKAGVKPEEVIDKVDFDEPEWDYLFL